MNHRPQCIPCFLNRVLQMTDQATSDSWLQRKLLGEAMGNLAHVDDEATPPEVMHAIFKSTAKTLGTADPYAESKQTWIQEVLANEEKIRSGVQAGEDPLVSSLLLSLLANEADDELRADFTLKDLLESAAERELDSDGVDEFIAAIEQARKVLFVHDSTGELFFDRLLLEQVIARAPVGTTITSVLRSTAVLADAVQDDARALGLDQVADLIDPGLDCLGLPLSECSTDLQDAFREADLVIAKGQAAYQSLSVDRQVREAEDKEIWFLFRVKCPVMAREMAAEIGSLIVEPA